MRTLRQPCGCVDDVACWLIRAGVPVVDVDLMEFWTPGELEAALLWATREVAADTISTVPRLTMPECVVELYAPRAREGGAA